MATATLSVPSFARRPSPAERVSAGAAAVLSVLGSMLAFGIAALGLLVVPVAAAVVFGPALLALF